MLYETAARAEEILTLNVEDLDLEFRRARGISEGGAIEYVHRATATARLLPRLLAGRSAPELQAKSHHQHLASLGRYVRLGEETSARITAGHDPAARRRSR
jgi:integrase